MMKRVALPLAALAAGAMAQDTTTITYSVCPTATTTTTTLSTTITYCPGASCNVNPGTATTSASTSTITKPPKYDGAYTSTVLAITFTGKDGKVTELNEYITVYPAPCPNGPGMCGATYTITEECPCTAEHPGDWVHPDFTTTVHECHRCGPKGEPTTITQTIPCSTGAYAHVTPTYGPWKPHKPGHGDDDEDVADAYGKPPHGGWNKPAGWEDNEAPVAGAHGDKPAAGENWNDNNAAPVAGAHGDKPAAGEVWNDNNAAPVAGAHGDKPAGAAPTGGDWSDSSAPVAGANGAAPSQWSDSNNVADAHAGAGGKTGADGKPVADYKGAGSKATVAVSSLFAVAIGALAVML